MNSSEKNVDPKETSTHFNAFNSALFITEFQGNEENYINQELKPSNSYNSYEKCLTNELLETIINDSNDTKKDRNILKQNNFNAEPEKNNKDEKMINSEKTLKISKNLFNQSDMLTKEKKEKNVKKKNNIYEENNNGFEYQLKFIENSVQNILPKSYKKSSYNSNNNSYYYNNNNNSFATFNKFNLSSCDNYDNSSFYKNENNYNYINNFCVSPFESNYDDNNYSLNYDNQKIKYQVHKLKVCDSNSYGWKCNKCYYLNKGYRISCVNCKNNRKAKF